MKVVLNVAIAVTVLALPGQHHNSLAAHQQPPDTKVANSIQSAINPPQKPAPNFDKDVLAPLRLAQQQAEAARLAAIKSSCDAQGGTLDGETCNVPPPVVQAPTPPQNVSYGANTAEIQAIIVKWANNFGVDPNWLLRVANCESGFNLWAYNPSGATGLFQFMPGTFAGNAPRAGAGNDIHNADDQARTAAYMFSIGQSGQWVCR